MTVTTLDSRGRRPLQSKKMTDRCTAVIPIFLGSSWAPTPTGEIEIFVFATDGGAFCDRNELGRPMVAPTIKKDDRRMHGGNPLYFSGRRGRRPLQSKKITDESRAVTLPKAFSSGEGAEERGG